MRQTIIGLAVFAAFTSPAAAADPALASPAAAAATKATASTEAPAAAAPFSWTGYYIGGNLGYGSTFGTADRTVGAATVSDPAPLTGFIGGGQVGYNWQTGNIVIGAEADLQGADMRHDWTATDGTTTVDGTDRISWFATVRGRLGYAVDNVLFYATAGWAYVTLESSGTVTGPGGSNPTSWSLDRSGWTAGGGMEVGFGDNWSGKLEYLYIDAGTFTGVDPLGAVPMSVRLQDHVLRIGVNYRFQ